MTYNVFSGTLNSTHSLASCRQQGRAGSKILLQQNPPVLNGGCQITQVDLYNGCWLVGWLVGWLEFNVPFQRKYDYMETNVMVVKRYSSSFGFWLSAYFIIFCILLQFSLDNQSIDQSTSRRKTTEKEDATGFKIMLKY